MRCSRCQMSARSHTETGDLQTPGHAVPPAASKLYLRPAHRDAPTG